jgi:HEPN domain-containing protein
MGFTNGCIWKRGATLSLLFWSICQINQPSAELMDKARVLDRHYIPTRYPNGFERGAPMDFYSRKDADVAIEHAEAIVEFCKSILG